jgi:alpha-tubulin suppressor-like RCC1 family protein
MLKACPERRRRKGFIFVVLLAILGLVIAGCQGLLGGIGGGGQTTGTIPPSPTTPTVGSPTSSSLVVSWSSVSEATSYNVYRSTSDSGTYSLVASEVTATSHTDSGLDSNTYYYYKVSAVNSGGESSQSDYASGLTLPGQVSTPTVGSPTISSLTVSWDALSGNGDVSYNIYRSTSSTSDFSPVASGIASISFTDTGLLCGTTYYYNVSGVNTSGEGAQSLLSSGATSTCPQIAGGGSHTIALKSDSTVWTWGWNVLGQLGDGTTTGRFTPVQVSGLTGVTAIAGGAYHTIALKNDGTVWVWGGNFFGQLGVSKSEICAGQSGQYCSSTPVQVSGLTGVTAIAGGGSHTIALKSDSTVWAWGSNSFGQLGDGTTIDSSTPVQVSGLTGVTAIAGRDSHTIALKNDGTVWTWGDNRSGQLGDGTTTQRTTPVQVSGLTGVIAIAGGTWHTIALKNDGTVWTWGYNSNGQLGDGTTTNSSAPVQVSGLTGVTAIASGAYHTITLKSDGTVWTWGGNNYGQLGDGTTTTSSPYGKTTPVQVSGLQ